MRPLVILLAALGVLTAGCSVSNYDVKPVTVHREDGSAVDCIISSTGGINCDWYKLHGAR